MDREKIIYPLLLKISFIFFKSKKSETISEVTRPFFSKSLKQDLQLRLIKLKDSHFSEIRYFDKKINFFQ